MDPNFNFEQLQVAPAASREPHTDGGFGWSAHRPSIAWATLQNTQEPVN